MGIRTYVLKNQILHVVNLSGLVISVLPLNQVRQSILAVRIGNVEKNKQKKPSISTGFCKNNNVLMHVVIEGIKETPIVYLEQSLCRDQLR